MSADDDGDPYKLHACRFVDKFRRLVERFRGSTAPVDEITVQFDKCWHQVLGAFDWASQHRSVSPEAAAICDALLACGNGDLLAELHRSPDQFQRLIDASVEFTKRLQDDPNGAAFVFRFAGISMTEKGLRELSAKTGVPMEEVLKIVQKTLPEFIAGLS